jgi:hypothetical protein
MPITVSGTQITFNDLTTQSTAATAGSIVTTANVLSATANATAGAVGSYAFMYQNVAGTYDIGITLAGSSLRYVGLAEAIDPTGGGSGYPVWYNLVNLSTTVPSGTWRCMGYSTTGGAANAVSLWLRTV